MSRLSEIVSFRRSQGGSVAGSLTGGIKERLKEKFDPRQLINQKGLLTALFPGLKPFKSKTSSTPKSTGKSIEDLSLDISDIKPIFEQIQFNTTISAKNLSVLPSIHRDFNVIRQNIVKLLKLEKIDAATKADMFFKMASKREEMYESQLSKLRENSKSPTKLDNSKSDGSISSILLYIGAAAILGLAFKGVTDALDKLQNVDLKKSFFDFTDNLTNSIDSLLDSLMMKVKNLNPEDMKPDAKISEKDTSNEKFDIPMGQLNIAQIFDIIKQNETGKDYNRAFGDFKTKSGKYENRLDRTEKFNIGYIKGVSKGVPQPKQKTPEEFSGKKLTEMSLSEVMSFIKEREGTRPGQSAVGAYQFMGSSLMGSIKRLNMPMDTIFDEKTQDKLALSLLEAKAGSLKRMNIPITPANLAMTWGVGEGSVGPILKAIREGKGGQKLGDILNQAGFSDKKLNRKNNPWMEQSTEQYYSDKIKKYGVEPVLPHFDNQRSDVKNDKISRIVNDMKTGQLVEAGSLGIMTDSVSASVPIVIINNNNQSDTVIVNVENEEPDIFHILSRSVFS
jgi:hypothetical protein